MWRSVLFVPVLQERFLAKAAERGADAILLDLEASIAANRKSEARMALPDAVDRFTAQNQDVLVRINMLWRPALADLEVAVRPGVSAIQLPNCRSAADIVAVDQVMAEIEAEKGLAPISLIPIIESAQGVIASAEIASASPRVKALTFGIEDYLADMESSPDPHILTAAALTIAHAARAAGIAPMVVPGTLADITDLDAFEAAARRGRCMGSVGGYAVHPGQVAVLNRVFSPSPEDIEWATRVVAAAAEAEATGLGAVSL
ncbi:MAG: aldolase/citrate lyase family protein, partial [Pseudomonadota bacterium]